MNRPSGRSLRRSILFVPGSRPDRYGKALASGADTVCIDLEDAVAPAAKDEARRAALEFLGHDGERGAEVVLRINHPRREAGLEDLLALCRSARGPDAVMIPKIDSPEEVRWVEAILASHHPNMAFIPMVETCAGLAVASDIAAASPRVTALLFGGIDLAAELGASTEWDAMLYARSRTVHAAALARVDAFDMPFLDVSDPEGLGAEARAASRLGFTGKTAIHPQQVPHIQEAFSPSSEDIQRAREIVDAYERNAGGVLLWKGRLVEAPVIRAAERTLAIAAAMD